MPSVLHILRWSIIGLQCLFLLIHIRIIAIVTLIPINVAGTQVKCFKFSQSLMLPAGGKDSIALAAFITFILVSSGAPWHREMQFVIHAIVVYRDVWVCSSGPRLLKHLFGCQILIKYRIVNTRWFHADDHITYWVLCLLHLTIVCSKSVFVHPLLLALR